LQVTDPKLRFSDRVENYVRFRPTYPRALRELVTRECGLGPGRVVADIGSGTGILSRLLLESGARVVGVEPNAPMRAAAEAALSSQDRFQSIDGSAETTGLPDASIDLIACAQAFHWFDPFEARAEFARILKPGGWVVLAWNQRRDTPLGRDYEDLLERFAPEYAKVRASERAAEPRLVRFFAPQAPRFVRFDHEQNLNAEGFRGRLLSSSYAPQKGAPLHEPMMQRLAEIFGTHQQGGVVRLAYNTVVWYGQLLAL
jgi:ubiquinone/menaquinone biosynthesis C-methylase UbiE